MRTLANCSRFDRSRSIRGFSEDICNKRSEDRVYSRFTIHTRISSNLMNSNLGVSNENPTRRAVRCLRRPVEQRRRVSLRADKRGNKSFKFGRELQRRPPLPTLSLRMFPKGGCFRRPPFGKLIPIRNSPPTGKMPPEAIACLALM